MEIMSEEDLAVLERITIDLYNLARRNGLPADLVHLHSEAQSTLNLYRYAVENTPRRTHCMACGRPVGPDSFGGSYCGPCETERSECPY